MIHLFSDASSNLELNGLFKNVQKGKKQFLTAIANAHKIDMDETKKEAAGREGGRRRNRSRMMGVIRLKSKRQHRQ